MVGKGRKKFVRQWSYRAGPTKTEMCTFSIEKISIKGGKREIQVGVMRDGGKGGKEIVPRRSYRAVPTKKEKWMRWRLSQGASGESRWNFCWKSVLQCVAVCGSVLQCVAVCCSVCSCASMAGRGWRSMVFVLWRIKILLRQMMRMRIKIVIRMIFIWELKFSYVRCIVIASVYSVVIVCVYVRYTCGVATVSRID